MDFYYKVKTEEDAEKLAGLVFFDSDENEDAAFEISGKRLGGGYSADNGGYDYDGCDDDANDACEAIKERVGKNARVMYVSQEDEGSGECCYIWSDFGETKTHYAVVAGWININGCDDDEWINSVKELIEEYGECDEYGEFDDDEEDED